MSPSAIKIIAFVGAAALAALAALELPSLDQLDGVIVAVAGALAGWSGLRRPGDAPVSK